MGEDDQSDLFLSSVRTSDLSDFHESDQVLSDEAARLACVIKELSERAHIPHAPHIDRSNAKFLK